MNALAALAGLEAASDSAACLHCGQPLTQARGTSRRTDYCCSGCEAAAALIETMGLSHYYEMRSFDPNGAPLRPTEAETSGLERFVHVAEDGSCRLGLLIDGLQCAACVWLIESVLARDPAIKSARLNMTTRRLALAWTGSPDHARSLVRQVERLGYRAVPLDAEAMARIRNSGERDFLRCLAVAGFAAGNVMMISIGIWAGHAQGMDDTTRTMLHWVSALIALPAIAYAGRPFFRSALAALRAGRTNMDLPISVGILLASAMSLAQTVEGGPHAYFDSTTALLFFLLIGRFLDQRARGHALASAEQLLALRTQAVTIVSADGSRALRHPDSVLPGEIIAVAAGERIGADGIVEEGSSTVDASLITGESLPARVQPGSTLFAGTVNLDAPLRLRATAAGESTLLAEIVRLMEAASGQRSRFVAVTDRVSRRFAPVVHTFALATFLGWWLLGGTAWMEALGAAIAVLIITCPCALALAVPVVQVLASGRLLRRGILMKSATALERLAEIDTIVFDKTGTLTCFDPVLVVDPQRDAELEVLAASMAAASTHPLARALARGIAGATVLSGIGESRGGGLIWRHDGGETRLGSAQFCGLPSSESHSPEILLATSDGRIAHFTFAERLREDALPMIMALKRAGLQVHLVSGDGHRAVASVAQALGIDKVQWRRSPADKAALLEALAQQGRKTLMVGDGLNDAPALAAAHVSMSPSSAADVSQSSADLVYQGEKLAPVLEAIRLARRSRSLAMQNLVLALLYNLCTVPLAMAGLVTPLIAALAMSSSSLLVIGNSFRLLRGKEELWMS